VLEELQARRSQNYEYPTYFTYPTEEQMTTAHERFREAGLFFSEIRELVGYRAAEALSVLAGLIRLETKGNTLNIFEECFQKLWYEFSRHNYARGYRTHIVRSNLVLMLGSNNVFGLVGNSPWQSQMLDYFETGTHEWTGEPLNQIYKHVIRILGGSDSGPAEDNTITKGVVDLDGIPNEDINSFCHSLEWEQGAPEEDLLLPPIMMHHDRRGPSQPPSDFYYLPFHLLRIKCGRFWYLESSILSDPFNRIAMHLFLSLDLRTRIVSEMGLGKTFTIGQAAKTCGVDNYSAQMAIGQLIKVGLVEFDVFSGEPWYSSNQEFVCRLEARSILEP